MFISIILPVPTLSRRFHKRFIFCGYPFEPCSRMETMNQLKVYKPNTGLLHWLHVMISKRPGTVESPGGIHRRRHQKRRKAVKLLPKCCPKQKSPAFRGVFSEKQSLYLRYFVILLKGLKSRKANFHYSSSIPESRFLVISSPFFRFWRA